MRRSDNLCKKKNATTRSSQQPPPVPASFAELVGIGEQVEGVRFAESFARLPIARAATGDEALRRVLELARAAAADSGPAGSRSRRRRRPGGHGRLGPKQA